MSNAEAVQIVHQMMEAREQEEARTAALASQVVTKKYGPANTRREFWEEVCVLALMLAWALMYTLLMAVLQ